MKMNLEKFITLAGVCAGVFTAVGAAAQVKRGIDQLGEIERQEQLALESKCDDQVTIVEG